jgi:DNA-binding GntR family transcriptional regulator
MAGTSKHYRVKVEIEEMIRRGEYAPGEQLPSEPELAEQFNVSRGTIRQVLGELAQEGVVSRRSGAGTIVMRKPKKVQIMSFSDQIKAAGLTPNTQILAQEQIMADQSKPHIGEAFLIDPEKLAETSLYRIDRLRCGSDQDGNNYPLARQIVYLLVSDFKAELLEEHDFTTSLFDLYQRYHRQVASAHEIIKARPATPAEIELFKMAELASQQQFVYERNRVSFDEQNQVLEVMTSVDRGDFFPGYEYRIVEVDEHLSIEN